MISRNQNGKSELPIQNYKVRIKFWIISEIFLVFEGM